ncbi:MAG: oxidoreductase, partial [Labilithrix sp.]|nr:oxidoreductase [Labilithrix sp.]
QVADLTLEGGRGEQASVSPLELEGGASGFGANTLREYAALARDIRDGTHLVPDFAYALRRHRLLAAIEEAARCGITQRVGEPHPERKETQRGTARSEDRRPISLAEARQAHIDIQSRRTTGKLLLIP